MNWEIITNSKDVSKGLDIVLIPANDVIRFVILQFTISDLPKLVYQTSKSISTGTEYAHILNFKDMDWEDKARAKNVKGSEMEEGEMFLVHDAMGETIIKESIFDKILFDYASKVLEVCQYDISLPANWENEMKDQLNLLDVKILREYSEHELKYGFEYFCSPIWIKEKSNINDCKISYSIISRGEMIINYRN